MNKFVLYDAANSPCGRRVRMTLLEKGQRFEIRWLSLALMEQKQDWYLRYNPSGVVPTLLHNELTIFDSNVINEYLDELIPEPRLMPETLAARAEVRMWLAFEMEWAKAFRDAIYQSYARSRLQQTGLTTTSLSAAIKKNTNSALYLRTALNLLNEPVDEGLLSDRLELLMERMAWMEDRLSDGREWLAGGHFSLADITLAPRIDMFPFIGISDLYSQFPRIGAFMDRIKARPSWQTSAVLPEAGEDTTAMPPEQELEKA